MSNFKPLMSPETYRIVMHNARSIARGHKRTPNWSFAMHMFSCGSTYGYMHCEHAEIDPDGVTVGEIWRNRRTPAPAEILMGSRQPAGYLFEMRYEANRWSGRMFSETINLPADDVRNVVPLYTTPEVAGWNKVPEEPTLEFLKSINADNQVLAHENGRYYNAWFEYEPSEGGWFWTDEADSEPNPSHYRMMREVALASAEVEG